MKISLAENIRALRKERKLTQEQLAEALGVTTGAVHKWEAGLSIPELDMIIRMAELFDTSVDALLGYQMKDDSKKAILERLATGCRIMDPETIREAELALTKYPNSFEIVFFCASAYIIFGMSSHDKAQIRRGRDLLEKALLLLPQNKDPKISEHTLYQTISAAGFALGETERSLDLLKEHNVGGLFNVEIATGLIYNKRNEEAVPFMAEGLYSAYFNLINSVYCYAMVFFGRRDYDAAKSILSWGLDTLTGLKTGEGPGYIDKPHSELLIQLAFAQLRTGGKDQAADTLKTAAELVKRFDEASDFGLSTLKYLEASDFGSVHDVFGATAAEGAALIVSQLNDEELAAMWKAATENE